MKKKLEEIINLTKKFGEEVDKLNFSEPVAFVYNPLDYALETYIEYLEIALKGNKKKTVFLGMNPGPWGMAQTGVPFGEIHSVKDWLGISGKVGKPEKEHPKRKISGLNCKRSEVSGRRLWGYFKEKYKTPDEFFKENFIANYCPLVFMEESGRNRTPDKLKKNEKGSLFKICDWHLKELLNILSPKYAIGIGAFAEKRLLNINEKSDITVGKILHPSPANPAANKGWAEIADRQLKNIIK